MTPVEPTPFDQGNPLLAKRTAQLTFSLQDTPVGQVLAATIRTETTTLTVILDSAEALSWADAWSAATKQMSASGLIVASGALANDHKVVTT